MKRRIRQRRQPPAAGSLSPAKTAGSSPVQAQSAASARSQSFSTPTDGPSALKVIVRFAQQMGYKIDAIDEASGRVVLSESASLTTWGFLYRILLTGQSDGTTLVDVGIESKLYQIGPVVTASHDRCVNGIKAALFANT